MRNAYQTPHRIRVTAIPLGFPQLSGFQSCYPPIPYLRSNSTRKRLLATSHETGNISKQLKPAAAPRLCSSNTFFFTRAEGLVVLTKVASGYQVPWVATRAIASYHPAKPLELQNVLRRRRGRWAFSTQLSYLGTDFRSACRLTTDTYIPTSGKLNGMLNYPAI
jgi:hypothetical protein